MKRLFNIVVYFLAIIGFVCLLGMFAEEPVIEINCNTVEQDPAISNDIKEICRQLIDRNSRKPNYIIV
jgi:hypothetical protein